MAADVFISYSHVDWAAAELLQRSLEASGIACFRDVTNIAGSSRWMQVLVEGIDNCEVVVLLLSNAALNSQHVHREHALAVEKKRRLLPIFLAERLEPKGELRFALAGQQRFLVKPDLAGILPEIIDAITRILDEVRHSQAYTDCAELQASANWTKTFALGADDCGLPVGTNERGSWEIAHALFAIRTRPGMYLGAEIAQVPRLVEVLVELTIASNAGPDDSWFGIEFGELWPGEYYQCLLNGRGAVRLSTNCGGRWTDLAVKPVAASYRPEASNVLRFARHANSMHVFLNDRFAVSADHAAIRSGKIGLVAGPGLGVSFSTLRVSGTDFSRAFTQVNEHWGRLEIREARTILKSIAEIDSRAVHPTEGWPVQLRLAEIRPDHRDTILVVVGSTIAAQVNDGSSAAQLCAEITRRGKADQLRRAFLVTDSALLSDEMYHRCPSIAVGGPPSNRWAAMLAEEMPAGPESDDGVTIRHAIENGDRRVGLWGDTHVTTVVAVQRFIDGGLLERFLARIWQG